MNKVAYSDPLTGIYNRRYVIEKFPVDLINAALLTKGISIIMVDIDYFKVVNDKYGHLAGDQTLKKVAETLSGCIKRGSDWIARYGGEEFLVCMNVFDFALKMEADGEKYYRELAVKTKYEELKVVLNNLADDEQRHYKIVQELQKRNGNLHFETDPALNKAENGFELGKNKTFMTKDKDSIVKLKAEQLDVYRAALRKEEESIQTYKKLKETAEQQTEKDILEKIGHGKT